MIGNRALRDLGHPERVRQDELDAARADRTKETPLQMDRLVVLERPAPLRVQQ